MNNLRSFGSLMANDTAAELHKLLRNFYNNHPFSFLTLLEIIYYIAESDKDAAQATMNHICKAGQFEVKNG